MWEEAVAALDDHGEALRAAGLTESGSGAGVQCEAEVGEHPTQVLS